MRDHPRVCGEKCCLQGPYLRRLGSPPRVRGKVRLRLTYYTPSGITPACAGKSAPTTAATRCIWDHPRVCGEKGDFYKMAMENQGSPPRVRGKDKVNCASVGRSGITPACAGKRLWSLLFFTPLWDHPRVCGEKCLHSEQYLFVGGSPPRVRGKVLGRPGDRSQAGITPACAGKRCAQGSGGGANRDHPRVCGEKSVVND